MLYCAKFYGRGFGRVYEPKTPVMKLCTVQHYPIIIQACQNPCYTYVGWPIMLFFRFIFERMCICNFK